MNRLRFFSVHTQLLKTVKAASSMAPSSSPVAIQRSTWNSPVPYLFAGLAAMLGLIAFALLILACSYWKLSGYIDNNGADGERDLEAGNDDGDSKTDNYNMEPPVLEEKYLVIMAGQAKPTFLATPISSRTLWFGSCSCQSNSTLPKEKSTMSGLEMVEKGKQGSSGPQVLTMENQETEDDQLP